MAQEPFLVRFARDYGWRAYAIPVLAVITIWVLVDVFSTGGASQEAAPQTSSVSTPTPDPTPLSGPDPADADPLSIPPTELPPGGSFTEQGRGTFRTVGNPLPKAGEGRVYTYIVEIEDGINTAAYGGDDGFVSVVDATLANPKGWTADPQFAFQHVAPDEDPDLRIQLTSLETTHALCGNDIAMETSCFYSDGNRVLINESRWIRGAIPFEGDLGSYRQYLINHEVGHGLGYAAHDFCAADGELAPIMMQQTLSVNNSELFRLNPGEVYPDDDATCVFNPWPYPRGL